MLELSPPASADRGRPSVVAILSIVCCQSNIEIHTNTLKRHASVDVVAAPRHVCSRVFSHHTGVCLLIVWAFLYFSLSDRLYIGLWENTSSIVDYGCRLFLRGRQKRTQRLLWPQWSSARLVGPPHRLSSNPRPPLPLISSSSAAGLPPLAMVGLQLLCVSGFVYPSLASRGSLI